MTVFEFEDYRDFLRVMIEENAEVRGYITRLADAAGCQKSYLSLVKRDKVHLTPEHAFKLAHFWGLSESEAEFFLQLVHLGRTDYPPLQAKILNRLKEIRRESESLAKRFQKEGLSDATSLALYYGSWIPSSIHVAIDIESLRTASALSQRLNVSVDIVAAHLRDLEQIKLIKKEGQKWFPENKSIHLPKESPFTVANHQNWRSRALLDSQRMESDGIHYTSVQTLSLSSFNQIKEKILDLIDKQRKIITSSNSEEVVCFTCDWFKI